MLCLYYCEVSEADGNYDILRASKLQVTYMRVNAEETSSVTGKFINVEISLEEVRANKDRYVL